MVSRSSSSLLAGLRTTMDRQGMDYERWIREFGQVAASERRSRGEQFSLRDHVRGLVLSQLSAQRPWGPIARNLDAIGEIFHDFDPDVLRNEDPEALTAAIKGLRCGNRQLARQMRSLDRNIQTLQLIESDHGSLDAFVTSGPADEVAHRLAIAGRYKLRYIGFTLALEYLRNVGIRAGKPDVHVRRILGGERLRLTTGRPSEVEAFALIERIATEAACNPTYVDNLLWIFCAQNYGNVCGARPRCFACDLRPVCRFPQNS